MKKQVNFSNFNKTKLKIIEGFRREKVKVLYAGKRIRNKGRCRFVGRIGNVIIKFDYRGNNKRDKNWYDYEHQTQAECQLYKKIKTEDKHYFPKTKSCYINGRLIELQKFVKGKFLGEGGDNDLFFKIITKLGKRYNRSDINTDNVLIYNNKLIVIDFGL